jgi:hypothetical protein
MKSGCDCICMISDRIMVLFLHLSFLFSFYRNMVLCLVIFYLYKNIKLNDLESSR